MSLLTERAPTINPGPYTVNQRYSYPSSQVPLVASKKMPAPPMSRGAGSTHKEAPWVEIIEQPSSKSTRFRYESENQQGGVLSGANSSKERQTYPAIKVHNHTGACVVVVSLVTHDEDRPRPHPHTLVGNDCRQGVCTKKVRQNLDRIQFNNLGIQCKKKSELKEALRLRQQIRVDPFRTGFDHMEKPAINNLNLMAVKLCFQVFLPDDSGKYQKAVQPVVSDPIFDKKSAGELSIHSYLPESANANHNGKEEMIILTGKLPKADEFEVRFWEGRSEVPDWEGFAQFTQKDIHQQCALTIKLPQYNPQNPPATHKHKVQVQFQLRKKNNPGEVSESRKFFWLIKDSRNRHSGYKREHGGMYGPDAKAMKRDPSADGYYEPQDNIPTMLESMDTEPSGMTSYSSSGSSNYSNPQSNGYQPPPPQTGPINYSYQAPGYPPAAAPQGPPAQYGQFAPPPQPHPQRPPPQFVQYNGAPHFTVKASNLKIYRNDDSGKVFMAPGPTAMNQDMPEKELSLDDFGDIEEILRQAREDPESEIHIPSVYSDYFNQLMNPTVNMLQAGGTEEVVADNAAATADSIQPNSNTSTQPDTTSLTKELKSLPSS